MNYFRVLRTVGTLVVLVSLTMLVPLVMAWGYGETAALTAFGIATTVGVVVGGLAFLAGRRGLQQEARYRDALAVVGLAWVFCAAVGCLPYILTDTIPGFISAYFETMSGFTTTGASVMERVEYKPNGDLVPHSILFWRCLTQWLGGIGIVVLFVAVLPAMGPSRLLFHMEVPGVGEKSFFGKIRDTAAILWLIYLSLTVLAALSLKVAGMTWFDSVCHSLTTTSTGGFSTHTESLAYFESSAIRIVTTVFMLLAGVNFMLYFMAARGALRRAHKNPELRLYVVVIFVVTAIVTSDLLWRGAFSEFPAALEAATFQVATLGTSTGFASENFDLWPATSKMLLLFLMFSGACAGSTSGGLKLYRILVVFKYSLRAVHQHIRPKGVETVRMGDGVLSPETLRSVTAMVMIFMLMFFGGAFVLSLMGMQLTEAFTASLSALGNVGPGLGEIGPTGNYANVPDGGKLLLAWLMLVGRLEVFTALSLLTVTLWRD